MDLLLRQVRCWGGAPRDLMISKGCFATEVEPGAREIDGRGLLALPGLVNAHAHVDKSWCGKPWQSYGGEPTTAGRIAHERARREELGIPGREVTAATLAHMLASGTTAMRSHVDVDLGVGLSGLEIVRSVAKEMAPGMRLELVAFPQDGVLRRPGVAKLLEEAAAAGVEHIGGLDPAGIDRDPAGQLDILFDIAGRHGCGIDIHLHDPGDLGAFQFELILDRIAATGLTGKVNIAHGFAISDLAGPRLSGLLDRLADAGVTFTSVAPLGRAPLPARAMAEAGVQIGLGTDGFRDLWSPFGLGDMLEVAEHHAQLTGQVRDEDLLRVLRDATSGGLAFVGEQPGSPTGSDAAGLMAAFAEADFAPGRQADLFLVDAENPMDALVRMPRRELVILAGQVIADSGELAGPAREGLAACTGRTCDDRSSNARGDGDRAGSEDERAEGIDHA